MADSMIVEIDQLLHGTGPAINAQSSKPAIGAIQDLLIGHGLSAPGLMSPAHGTWNKATGQSLLSFCKQYAPSAIQNKVVKEVSRSTLEAMLKTPAQDAIASQVYVALVLEQPYVDITKVACLVAIGEGNGKFGAICLNKDKAGLSLGMIQWAQVAERLHELLLAVPKSRLDQALGGSAIADAVLAHTKLRNVAKKIYGGVKKENGLPEDPAMDLTKGDWPRKFKELCRFPDVQVAQIKAAAAAFEKDLVGFNASLASKKSDRLVAYLLDVANQFGKAAQTMFKDAVNQGGLTGDVEAQGQLLIDRVTDIANKKLEAIGKKIGPNNKQKWTDEFIHKVQKSRSDRAKFFKDCEQLKPAAQPVPVS